MGSKPSKAFLLSRALCAVALMVGFYLLAISIAGGLAYLPIAEIRYANHIHIKLALICFVSAGIILWSILPRIDRFPAPGPRLLPHDHPRLFDLLRRIAKLTNQEMPAEVYLCPDVNAWVSQRGGVMGIGSRRVMGIGLPLLQVFNVSEFSAVLAHEFGHYHGGDTKLGPWIYKTRAMIGRTIGGLGKSVLQLPFLWYGNLYLRITHAISRRQEYLADELAARTVSPGALISGLKKVHVAGLGFHVYLNNELAPVVNQQMRVPFLEGFNRFRSTKKIEELTKTHLDEELKDSKADPYDTHPALKDRIAALDQIQCASSAEDTTLAIELLSDYQRYDGELLAALAGRTVEELKLVNWDELGNQVYLPLWKKNLSEHAHALKNKTIADIYDLARNPEQFISSIYPNAMADAEEKIHATTHVFGTALCVTLAAQGWTIDAQIGEPIHMKDAGQDIEPFDIIERVCKGTLDRAEWDRSLGQLGAVELALQTKANANPPLIPS